MSYSDFCFHIPNPDSGTCSQDRKSPIVKISPTNNEPRKLFLYFDTFDLKCVFCKTVSANWPSIHRAFQRKIFVYSTGNDISGTPDFKMFSVTILTNNKNAVCWIPWRLSVPIPLVFEESYKTIYMYKYKFIFFQGVERLRFGKM